MKSYLRHYIDGAWTDSDGGTRHAVIDPATEQPVSEITLGSRADVDAAVAAARRAFPAFAATPVAERAALLDRIIAGYQARAADLAQAISEEMGAPIGFAAAAQVPAGLGHLIGARKAMDEFVWEERVGRASHPRPNATAATRARVVPRFSSARAARVRPWRTARSR